MCRSLEMQQGPVAGQPDLGECFWWVVPCGGNLPAAGPVKPHLAAAATVVATVTQTAEQTLQLATKVTTFVAARIAWVAARCRSFAARSWSSATAVNGSGFCTTTIGNYRSSFAWARSGGRSFAARSGSFAARSWLAARGWLAAAVVATTVAQTVEKTSAGRIGSGNSKHSNSQQRTQFHRLHLHSPLKFCPMRTKQRPFP